MRKIRKNKKTTLKWAIVALTLTLIVGCASLTNPINPPDGKNQGAPVANSPQTNTAAPNSQLHPDSTESLLFNMMVLGQQGKVINSDFPVKTTTIEDVEKVWGKTDKTDYLATAKGRYATYNSRNAVFGMNKGEQIFEVRSYDSRLKGVTLNQTKETLGVPAYNAKNNGQEIIGYTAGSEFKAEMIFPQPTKDNPNPVMDHYNVLYPQGTVNSMADDPGRQW